jgi:microcystin-dependent protein
MADPFVAEIRIFPFSFAPKGWAFCDGQLLPLSQNTALFSLLGTTYGGDGKSNFALPNMQGSAPMHPGQGKGLSLHDLGEIGGTQSVTLIDAEMPAHNHFLTAQTVDNADITNPGPTITFAPSVGGTAYQNASDNTRLGFEALAPAGSSFPHNNMQPFLTLSFCIALQGVFPPRG